MPEGRGSELTLAGHGHLRASQADRERAIDVLKAGFAEGRLDQDEYAERVKQVYVSRTYADLSELTADLPVGPLGTLAAASASAPQPVPVPAPAAASRATSGVAVASMVVGFCIFPFADFVPFAFLATLLGAVAIAQTGPAGRRGRPMAVIGLVLGLIGLVSAAGYIVLPLHM
jgi:hypothetical protein